jgi:hypothetical protein
MYFKPGMTVRVNKDIIRVKEWRWDLTGLYPVPIPIEEKYANLGDMGVVIDTFKSFYAKVKINDKIKTFRFTSLEIIKPKK